MRNTITLNGINNTEIPGLLIQTLPAISKPLMRTEIEEIDGRDGDIITPLGFSAYDKEITVGLYGTFDINQIIAYFTSAGTVIFSNEPNKFYNYQIIDQIDFERLVRYKTATVTMHCQPFKYSTEEGADILSGTDNFATLDQSINTDAQYFSYTSNTQEDVTATRNNTGTGSKFFATFTMNVVQGITYYFSGKTADGVTMYGYKDRIWGTSAGFGGRKLTSYSNYTATYTGQLIIGFYGSGKNPIFIRNFFATNEAGSTISGEGSDITLENTTEAPFATLDVKGDTNQASDPTPNAPVTIQTVSGGQTIEIAEQNLHNGHLEQGKINANGSVSTAAERNRVHSDVIKAQPNTKYRLYFEGGENTQAFVFEYNSTTTDENTLVQRIPSNWTEISPFEFTTSGTTASIRFLFRRSDNSNVGPGDFQNVIFEQIKQKYEINLGKNQFDKDNANEFMGYFDGTKSDPALVYSTGDRNRVYWIECQPNTTYSLSFENLDNFNPPHVGTTAELPADAVSVSKLANFTSGSLKLENQTTNASAKYLVIRFQTKAVSIKILDVIAETLAGLQIEKGPTATSYAPYKEPIELAKIGNYQDKFIKNGDTWYLHKEIGKTVLPTSDYTLWSTHPEACIYYRNNAVPLALYQDRTTAMLSEKFAIKPQIRDITTYYNNYAADEYGLSLKTGTQGVVMQNTDITTLADFHAWIAANPVTLYHALATPTDTEITDAALIEQLEALHNSRACKGRTHITVTSDGTNLPHIIAVSVAGNMDGTITNSGNTTARPKLTIFGSGNIGINLNGVQIFEIALGTEGHITIDTNAMEAYQDTPETLMNRLVTGDYSNFVLNPGENTLTFTGNATMCVVENYSRWI